MAIKKVSFRFDVPLTTLLSLIATGNADMHIDVFGDDKPARLARGAHPLLLEAPKKASTGKPMPRGKDGNGHTVTAYDTILKFLAARPKQLVMSRELKQQLVAIGLAANSVSPQLTLLKKRGLIESPSNGMYMILREGIEEAKRRGLAIGEAPKAKQPKTPKKSPAKKPAATASVNGANVNG